MPAGFEKCEREKGRIRRISGPSTRWKVPRGHYRNICWDKQGMPHRGELHKKQLLKRAKAYALKKLQSN